jgi:hypothetical protein
VKSARSVLGVLVLGVLGVLKAADLIGQSAVWLDQPLTSWNRPAAPLARGPVDARAIDDARQRCKLDPPSSEAERALATAGWIPQPHLDRRLVQGDVEILSGASSLDADCSPAGFNLFVFVSGTYAGTLSPSPMSPRADGVAGPVRFTGDLISAEFARFKSGDAVCCPSARMTVRYRIERTPPPGLVVPADVRTTRSF